MNITLAVGATSVTLPPDLFWSDEDSWAPVQQAVERSLTGALVIDLGDATAGRSITLVSEDTSAAWMTPAVLDQLKAWAAVAGQEMTLTLGATAYTVMWRHHDKPAIDPKPVVHFSSTTPEQFYLVTLKFMEI